MDVDLVMSPAASREPRREQINGMQVSRLALEKRRGGKLSYAYQYLAFLVLSFSELKLQQRVSYQGEQPQHVIARAVAHCDLGIIANLRTVFTEINLPTRIFEYLALGQTCHRSRYQGIRDYFNSGSILLFNAGDAESLASQIQWVFDHPQDTATLIQKGQDIYRHHLWSIDLIPDGPQGSGPSFPCHSVWDWS